MVFHTSITRAAVVLAVLLAPAAARAQDLDALSQQYSKLSAAGRQDEAERVARGARDLARARGDAGWVAAFGTKLGLSLLMLGRHKESETVLKQAEQDFERVPNPVVWMKVQTTLLLGEAVDGQGRYREAELIYRRALEAHERAGADASSLANNHRVLALALQHQGKFSEAEQALRRGLAIQEKGSGRDHPEVVPYLTNLADFAHQRDRLSEAEGLYRRALAIAEKDPDSVRPGHGITPPAAVVILNLAGLLLETDRTTEADAYYRRGLAILVEALGPAHPQVAAARVGLGKVAYQAGRFAEAEGEFKASLAAVEQAFGPEHPELVSPLGNLAAVYVSEERFAEAEPLYRRALAIREKTQGADHPDTVQIAANLARACRGLKRFDEAELLYERALTALEKALGHDHSAVAYTLYLIANFRKEQGRLDEAERDYRRVIAIYEKAHGVDAELTNHSRYLLGDLCIKQGHFDEGIALLDRAITGFDRVGAAPMYGSSALLSRASALWNQGSRPAALDDVRRAFDLLDQQRTGLSGAERERSATAASLGSAYELMIQMQFELEPDKRDLSAVFGAMERAHTRALLEEMAAAGSDLNAGQSANQTRQQNEREAELKSRVLLLERKLSRTAGPDDPTAVALTAELGEARNALYKHERDAKAGSRVYRNLLNRGTALPRLEEIQRTLLRPGDLMLVYFFGDGVGITLAVTRDSAAAFGSALDAHEAEVLGVDEGPLTADRLRRVLLNDKGTGIVQKLADPKAVVPVEGLAILADTLLPPDRKQALTDGTIKRLIVVPYGPLAMLPLEALVMEAGAAPKYLLDVGPPVAYAPSAAVVKNLTERPAADPAPDREPVLALGNPAYGGAGAPAADSARGAVTAQALYRLSGGKLPPLPFSGWEAQWVAKAFNDQGIKAGVLSGATATERAVRYWAPGRKILHLACHGLADQELGNFFGALAFAPGPKADDPDDDGYLRLSDIHALDLRRCELAILSACETNLGPQQKGEGTFAFSRAFLIAGARRVVASNWLVDDEAAASLVSVYCARLASAEKEGRPADYAGALREAKQWVRKQEKWKAPYYWASLVLVGPG